MDGSARCLEAARPPRCGDIRRRRSFHPVETDLAIEAAILLPVRLDLDVEEEMDLAAEQYAELGPRRLADRLDPGAALAQHDRPLGRAADQYLLVDGDRAVLP